MGREGIACTYCGGHHVSVADVRACWERTLVGSADHQPLDSEQPRPGESLLRESRPESTPGAARPGPEVLGRNLVVVSGAGDRQVPPPWDKSEIVTVDPHDASSLSDRLGDHLLAMAQTRKRVVFRVPAVTPHLSGEVARASPCELGPEFRFSGDLIRHLVESNAVDLRDSARPRFPPVERAVTLGARSDGRAGTDVSLPDGTSAFCDGGPPRFFTGEDLGVPGAAVIHRVTLEHGSLTPFGANENAAPLAADQLAAVTSAAGAARIIAPAGSGKTRVLTERARHLLRNWHVPGAAVCLVAFNRRAADEMRERTADLPGLQVRTLNSLALAIVNGTPPFRPRPVRLRTIDERDVRTLLAELVDFPRRANTDPAAAWLEGLSAIRLGLRDPDEVEDEYRGDLEGLTEVFPRYRQLLAERGWLDFDDQIFSALEVLLTEPETRAAAQRACRLLLVDEFQDLTPAHVLLVRLVAGPDGAVFGVGDDDQTIYGYAGATPEWLLRFTDLFPGASKHALTVNYRCSASVVAGVGWLLQRNRRRVAKHTRPAPGRSPQPRELEVLRASEDSDATSLTACRVGGLVEGGAAPDGIAVLSRVNASLGPVQVALNQAGVPARKVLDEAWLNRTGVRAALAWLRLAARPGHLRSDDIVLAARRPPRAISPRVIDWMAEQSTVARLQALADRLSGRDTGKVANFASDLEELAAKAAASRSTVAVLRSLRDQVGLDRALQSLEGARRQLDRSAHTDDLDALVALANLHADPDTFEAWLREELRRPGAPDGVMLATVHSVKGQEWPHVVVHAASVGLMPHRLALDIEEERRVFHVAITRAAETATVVAGEAPSPFIAELLREPADDPRPTTPVRPTRVDSPPRKVSADPGASAHAGELLREWRLQRSRTDGKPAFTILHDSTISDIAAALPSSRAALSAIKGIGPSKLERFGDEILSVVDRSRSTQPGSGP